MCRSRTLPQSSNGLECFPQNVQPRSLPAAPTDQFILLNFIYNYIIGHGLDNYIFLLSQKKLSLHHNIIIYSAEGGAKPALKLLGSDLRFICLYPSSQGKSDIFEGIRVTSSQERHGLVASLGWNLPGGSS